MISGILARSPADFQNSGQIISRGQPAQGPFDIQDENLQLRLALHSTTDGTTFGVLSCGPSKHVSVGIPLVQASQRSVAYTRPRGQPAALLPFQSVTNLVHLQVYDQAGNTSTEAAEVEESVEEEPEEIQYPQDQRYFHHPVANLACS